MKYCLSLHVPEIDLDAVAKGKSQNCEAMVVSLECIYDLLQGLLRRGSHLFGYIMPNVFVLKVNFNILVSYLMFSLEQTFFSNHLLL
jgi:hypothetical protein